MGKHIASLTAVTVMRAAGEVSRPGNLEVEVVVRGCLAESAAVLNEVCTTLVESWPVLNGFPPVCLEFLVSLSDGRDVTQQAEKEAKIISLFFELGHDRGKWTLLPPESNCTFEVLFS